MSEHPCAVRSSLRRIRIRDARQLYNAIATASAAIARCVDVADVIAAVNFAS